MVNKQILKKALRPLSWINRWIPKNPRRVLFYSNLGFRDNVRAQYEYMVRQKEYEDCTFICSVQGGGTPAEYPTNVKFVGKLQGLLNFFISGLVFYSFGKYPIYPARDQKVVNLWHGMPLKCVGNMREGYEEDTYDYFTHMISTAELFNPILEKSFSCKSEQILLTGQPRCDKLFVTKSEKRNIILWMPTYRQSTVLGEKETDGGWIPLLENPSQWECLDAELANLGLELWIKPHPLQNMPSQLPVCAHIRIISMEELQSRGQEVWDLFPESVALITDYSSVSFDYLLLDRPIAYVTQDMKDYGASRGFTLENPAQYMPGPFIESLEGLIEFINKVSRAEDNWKEVRCRVNAQVNAAQTGNAAERILKAVNFADRKG